MVTSEYAPILIFAFNRLEQLKQTIASLLANEESSRSDLYVFVDGPRMNKPGESEAVNAVRDYVKTIEGFKTIHNNFSKQNNGLGPSIISGVTEVINKYGKAIILEDDLIFSENFLSYMNQGLDRYQNEQKVFSICGYSNIVKIPKGYTHDTYFCTRSSSWGWATWADRWNSVDWELPDWEECKIKAKAFNNWGGSDCFSLLNGWKVGRNKSWAIRFCFAQFCQDKLSLFPILSKVNCDNGFAGTGTNCKSYSRFRYEFDTTDNKSFSYPLSVSLNRTLYKSAMSYNSLLKRIWSKIMYTIKT